VRTRFEDRYTNVGHLVVRHDDVAGIHDAKFPSSAQPKAVAGAGYGEMQADLALPTNLEIKLVLMKTLERQNAEKAAPA
jgi:hypothetical protein